MLKQKCGSFSKPYSATLASPSHSFLRLEFLLHMSRQSSTEKCSVSNSPHLQGHWWPQRERTVPSPSPTEYLLCASFTANSRRHQVFCMENILRHQNNLSLYLDKQGLRSGLQPLLFTSTNLLRILNDPQTFQYCLVDCWSTFVAVQPLGILKKNN